MTRRSRARYLAPIALVAVIAGIYVVVHDGLHTSSKPGQSTTVTNGTTTKTTKRHRVERTKFYIVRSGDSLTSIATKTGIALTTLEDLNHGVDPNALQTGQRIRLRQ